MDYDTIKDELLSVADSALKHAKTLDKGAEFEVFVYNDSQLEAQIDQGIVTSSFGSVSGNAVRVAIGTRLGFACSSGATLERVKLSAKEALSIVNSTKAEDKRFKGFNDSKTAGKEGAFDRRILEVGTDDLIRISSALTDDAKRVDDRVKTTTAGASVGWGAYAVANSRGVLAGTRFGGNSCTITAQTIVGDERRSSFEFDLARDRLVRPEGLGETAAKYAVGLLGAEKLDVTAKMATIWTPIPAALYILASMAQSATGQLVVEGISPLCDKIGDTIGSKQLTIIDDGQAADGTNTFAIDAEGHPQQRNTVVQDGVLKSYLFDSYYGQAFEVGSTGNCARGANPFGNKIPYERGPSVASKFMRISPGGMSESDILDSVDGKALLIREFPLGILHSDPATGEFSIVANAAYLVEKGEIKKPVQPVSIAGNFYDGFRNLAAVGNDVRMTQWGCETPTLVFSGFSVVG